ncbi:unnamed protein product [Acanthoscelides obtectus]|uniref:Uncharacterized protein n=1 Tax=Acanthoscelides obtectus TaxID=200917 RepID=A0A9P0QBE6_ACAOB|nr:unnamed protein product [Acanthoscelides obtectus]CAK1688995.1 hypothetical protein AOBTE_LOCUS36984 [Acanthoscelides obtectus]
MPDTDVYSLTGRAPGAYPIGSESQAPTLSSFVLRGEERVSKSGRWGDCRLCQSVTLDEVDGGYRHGCLATAPSRKVSGGGAVAVAACLSRIDVSRMPWDEVA